MAIAERQLEAQSSTGRETLTGGQAVMRSLERHHVKKIAVLPGGAIMPTFDALYDYPFERIEVTHEQGGTHIMDGYARATGEVGVGLFTSGPGATNTLTGLYTGQMDNVPMVIITGNVASTVEGTRAFQEADIVSGALPFTKWAYQIKNVEEIPAIMDQAFHVAQDGAPGPALIDIPRNWQVAKAEFKIFSPAPGFMRPELTPQALGQIERAADLLNKSKRPYILAGQGVSRSRAAEALKAVAEKGGIPVATTLLGLSSMPSDHSLYVGGLGMHGDLGANINTNRAQTILGVGMRFDDRVTGKVAGYAKQAQIIHMDINLEEFNRVVNADVAIQADALLGLQALAEALRENSHEEWLEEFRKLARVQYERVTRKAIAIEGPLTMAGITHIYSKLTQGKTIAVADVGQHQMAAFQHLMQEDPYSFFTTGGAGTMGWGLPAAIGIKIAHPEKEVVLIVGDGGFQMTEGELTTAANHGVAVKIALFNNRGLGLVRQWQEDFWDGRRSSVDRKRSSVDRKPPDFVKIAESRGFGGEKVTRWDEVEPGLVRMLTSPDAYLLDFWVDPNEKILPIMPPGANVDQIILEPGRGFYKI
ncbi:biosynthetic-type acetolactate synthase large subunit [Candidatus Daviesbacteria bacterium]|nr:biosynthetic-type acetolactate synthase large subunit [Candidatus Daviesbacteria bacterium]